MKIFSENERSTSHKTRLAGTLFLLRSEMGWSLDELAHSSGISRATLSRIENAEVSPTAETLFKLCSAFDIPVSQVLARIEDDFADLLRYEDQAENADPETGITCRTVSPEKSELKAQLNEIHMPPASHKADPAPSGVEHHVVVLDGALTVTLNADSHDLTAGDCLRYLTGGVVEFATGPSRGARYLVLSV